MTYLTKKIIGLDLLRFIMAILMVAFHVQALLTDSIFNYLALNGFYGTSVFLYYLVLFSLMYIL